MSARPIVRLADEDSRIGLVNQTASLASSLVRDLGPLKTRIEEVVALDPTMADDPDIKDALHGLLMIHHRLAQAVNEAWGKALEAKQ